MSFYQSTVKYYFALSPRYPIVEVYILDFGSSEKKHDCQMLEQNETRFWLVGNPLVKTQCQYKLKGAARRVALTKAATGNLGAFHTRTFQVTILFSHKGSDKQ